MSYKAKAVFSFLVIIIHVYIVNTKEIKSNYVKLWKRIPSENLTIDIDLDFELLGGEQKPTLFEVLVNASHNKPEFECTFKYHPEFGPYILSIGGLYENTNKSLFWMVYEKVGNEEKLLDNGISSTYVSGGQQYLFWYRTYKITEPTGTPGPTEPSFSSKLFHGHFTLLFICSSFIVSLLHK